MDSPHDTHCWVGCPIRRSRDQRVLAPPPGFSQRATSFIASQRQGIHQMPLVHSPRSSSEPQPGALHQNEVAVPTAKPERRLPKRAYHAQKIVHPGPPAPCYRSARPSRIGRTHATIAPERLPAPRQSRHVERRSIAMPAFDQTCLFTMYKEQPPGRRSDDVGSARPSETRHEPAISRRHKGGHQPGHAHEMMAGLG